MLPNVNDRKLVLVASGFSIEKEAFTYAWHICFHDSKHFMRGTFDFFDVDCDGVGNAIEIEDLVSLVLAHGGVICFL